MSDYQPPLLRPRPRRTFDLPPSSEPSEPSTPAEPVAQTPDLTLHPSQFLSPKNAAASSESGSVSVSRTGSIMNLTSPTLYGIYSPTAFEGQRDESSPWGTEPQSSGSVSAATTTTRAAAAAVAAGDADSRSESQSQGDASSRRRRRAATVTSATTAATRSRLSHGVLRGVILPLVLRGTLLFGFGVVYGVITQHVHENHWITPVKLENLDPYYSWEYLGFWGLAGVLLGSVLPWLDSFYDFDAILTESQNTAKGDSSVNEDRTLSWTAAVRSVGAFVGIAFAMVSL